MLAGMASSGSISPSKSSGEEQLRSGAGKPQRRRFHWYEARKIPLKLGGADSSTDETALTASLASPTSTESRRHRDDFGDRKKRKKAVPGEKKSKKD